MRLNHCLFRAERSSFAVSCRQKTVEKLLSLFQTGMQFTDITLLEVLEALCHSRYRFTTGDYVRFVTVFLSLSRSGLALYIMWEEIIFLLVQIHILQFIGWTVGIHQTHRCFVFLFRYRMMI